ncbi:MAG TPA: DUF1592 domain-containing protein [Bryobacteraceae bacterium]|nr:DUF1592 domain-containing protein [Bryobacteraceae bacterium]
MRAVFALAVLVDSSALLFGETHPANGSLRRLTHSQYNNTVRDLLGDNTRRADAFPQEDYVNGFKNQIAAQDISPLLAEAYNTAAERLAKSAFLGGTDTNHLIPCKPSAAGCANKFLRSFGLRAFRRPLTDVEFRRYKAVFMKGASGGSGFLSGAQLVIEAMLQSPKFLFRADEPRPYAIATRLSYFLWDTMPDEALFRAAAAGELSTPAGVNKAIERMIADPRAREAVDEFAAQWLRFDLAQTATKDRALYPEFSPELAIAMTEETKRLISDLVWNDRRFTDLFTAPYTYLNSDLASLYGIPQPLNDFDRVPLPDTTERAGILGHGMFLTQTSKPGETSPTVRGYFIREHFFCHQVPDPPPGTNSNLPPLTVDRPQTNRDRLTEHLINRSCAGCHSLMDPIGFGFEKFDAIGKRREKQTIKFFPDRKAKDQTPKTVALDLDTSGKVLGMANSDFRTPVELGRILANSPGCQECIVKQLFRYAYGRRETDTDRKLISEATTAFRDSQFRLKVLIIFLGRSLALPPSEGN